MQRPSVPIIGDTLETVLTATKSERKLAINRAIHQVSKRCTSQAVAAGIMASSGTLEPDGDIDTFLKDLVEQDRPRTDFIDALARLMKSNKDFLATLPPDLASRIELFIGRHPKDFERHESVQLMTLEDLERANAQLKEELFPQAVLSRGLAREGEVLQTPHREPLGISKDQWTAMMDPDSEDKDMERMAESKSQQERILQDLAKSQGEAANLHRELNAVLDSQKKGSA